MTLTRIMIMAALIVCVMAWTCATVSAAPSMGFSSASNGSRFQLRLAPGAWQRAVGSSAKAGQLRPQLRHLAALPRQQPKAAQRVVSADDFGTLRQRQTAPPPPQPTGFLTPGTPTFYLFVIDMTMLVGSLAVQIGSNIAAGMGADLTGWKVAGLVLDGVALATAIGMLASVDMSQFPPFFSIIMYVSLGLSALSLIWGGVQLGLYVHRRNQMREQRRRRDAGPQGPNQQPRPPVVVVPWGGVDQDGNPAGGLAMAGQF